MRTLIFFLFTKLDILDFVFAFLMKIPRKIRNMIISWYQNGNEMEILIFFILICLSDNSFVYHGLSEINARLFLTKSICSSTITVKRSLGHAHNTHSPYGYIISVGDFADIT